jgi:hypothetical protein
LLGIIVLLGINDELKPSPDNQAIWSSWD